MHVAIQLGHCYRKRGSTGTEGEQQYATNVGKELQRRLRALGHRCDLLLADEAVPKTDVFVAIHGDGSTNKSARGCSVGYREGTSGVVANQFARRYQAYGFPGGRRADNYTKALRYYYGTGKAKAAGTRVAFIIEGGFLTNPEDRAFMQSTKGVAACAQALVDAITGNTSPPTIPDTPDEEYDMKNGDKGGQVTVLQWDINMEATGMTDPYAHAAKHPEYEVPEGAVKVDAVFGPATEKAVKRLQAGWGYEQHGRADVAFISRIERHRTYRAMREVIAKLEREGAVGGNDMDVDAMVEAVIEEMQERLES